MRKAVLAIAALIATGTAAQNTIHLYKKDGSIVNVPVSELDSIVFEKAQAQAYPEPDPTPDPEPEPDPGPVPVDVPSDFKGEITRKGDIDLTRVGGWMESGYAEWTPTNGADGYNVYYKKDGAGAFTQIDAPLVRSYGSYIRADMVGLPAGDYTVKVEATRGGKITGNASEGTFHAYTYSRQGFAFAKNSVTGGNCGAYKSDGSLKDNAVVLYITEKSKNTVSMDVKKDSKGNTETAVGIANILNLMAKGYETRPVAIRIIGQVTKSGITGSDQYNLLLKANNTNSPIQNITVEGIGEDATCYGWGVRANRARSIEVRNLGIMLFGDDGIALETDNYNVWIHHNDIFYGAPGSDADQVKGDGSMDLKNDSKYITISFNHFFDSGKMSLCGMKSETGPNYISYDHNWFDHSDSRHPRIRTMSVHVWNNYYDGVAKYGVGVTCGASAFVESNYFRHVNKPMMSSMQGTDALGAKGTFSGENGGVIKSFGNIFAEKSSSFSFITYAQDNKSFDAYEASSRSDKVPGSVAALKGGSKYDNFDTNSSLMYSYTPHKAEEIPSIVTQQAGRVNGGDFKWAFNNSVDDESYAVNSELKSAIQSYKTKLKSIFGE